MKLKEWIQSIGKRYGLKNGQGVALGGGVYGKYYETTPQRKASPPPPPRPSNLQTEMNLDIVINGVVFKEIDQPFFVVYEEEDKFPFLKSALYDCDARFPAAKTGNFPRREYKSVSVNGKFYAPTFNTKEK